VPRTNERTFSNHQEIRVYMKPVIVMVVVVGVVVVVVVVVVTPTKTTLTTTMGVIR
jgi:hypothetical protein